jgi:osmotically-inducible protein OsmY
MSDGKLCRQQGGCRISEAGCFGWPLVFRKEVRIMLRLGVNLLAAGCCLILSSQYAAAQYGGSSSAMMGDAGGASSGMFGGSRQMGGSLSAGQGSMITGSNMTNMLNQVIQSAGTLTGNEPFLNRQPGQFVGTDATAAQSVASSMYGSEVNVQNQTSFQSMGNQTVPQPGAQGSSGMQMPQYRTRMEVDFSYPPANTSAIAATVIKRLQACHGIKSSAPIEVAVRGQTAILRGQVSSDHDRLLAEQLLRLEPGIWLVQNELTVSSAAAATPKNSAGTSPARTNSN